jgi:hypothetical protein
MLDARLFIHRFVRRYPGGDKSHAGELKMQLGLLRADEVTKMWRIEGSAENADPHRR